MSWNRNVKFYCVMWCTGSSKWGVRWGPSFLLEYRYCGRFAPAVPPAVFVLLRAVPRSLSSFVCRFCPCLPCRVLWGRPVAPGFPVVGGFSASAVRVLPSSLVASFGCVSVRSSRFVARCGGWCLLVLPSFLFFACFRSLRVWLLRVRLRCVLWFRRRFPPSSSGWLLRCPRLPPPPSVCRFCFFFRLCCWGGCPAAVSGRWFSRRVCVCFRSLCVVFSAVASFWRVSSILPLPCACSFRSLVVCALVVAVVASFRSSWWRLFGIWSFGCAFAGVRFALRVPVWLRCFAFWLWGVRRASWRRSGFFFLLFGKKLWPLRARCASGAFFASALPCLPLERSRRKNSKFSIAQIAQLEATHRRI